MWLAFHDRGYHFDWDPEGKRWIDDKGEGLELYATIARITLERAGLTLTIA
jgi:frataxin-like iron-binding protein CyaY